MSTYSVYIDGHFVPEIAARLSVFDHGLLYGDGVFEEVRAYDGGIFHLRAHLDALYRSAAMLSLAVPLSRDALANVILDACRVNHLTDATIRVIVTRGTSDPALNPNTGSTPTVIVIAGPRSALHAADPYRGGIRLATVSSRITPDVHRVRLKSLSQLATILGKRRAQEKGADEGLLLHPRSLLARGYVSETTAGPLFILRQGDLVTPPPNHCLDSVTRRAVLETAALEGFRVAEDPLLLSDVYNAEEAFIADTAAQIVPVVTVDNLPVGAGEPGPLTRQLAAAYRRYVYAHRTPIPPARPEALAA